jgi:mRNA interferase RelE/StbE
VSRKLSLTNDADKFLARLDAKPFRQVVRRVFALITDATPSDSSKLEGSNFHRVDQGEYRIVYFFDSDTVYIVVIGKRNDDEVYAKLKRK